MTWMWMLADSVFKFREILTLPHTFFASLISINGGRIHQGSCNDCNNSTTVCNNVTMTSIVLWVSLSHSFELQIKKTTCYQHLGISGRSLGCCKHNTFTLAVDDTMTVVDHFLDFSCPVESSSLLVVSLVYCQEVWVYVIGVWNFRSISVASKDEYPISDSC